MHSDVIDKAVDAAYEGVSEEKQAREFLRRKRLVKPKDQKEAARVFRQLARGGFGPKTIFSILKKVPLALAQDVATDVKKGAERPATRPRS